MSGMRTSESATSRYEEGIDFGELPPAVDALLQQGVVAYRRSPPEAEARFRQALELAPRALPVYFCLYKVHTYQGNLDGALVAALAGLEEAANQAGWPPAFDHWPPGNDGSNQAVRFALYTLKALAFIRMKRGELQEARRILERLALLDPMGRVGWPVVRDLFKGLSS